MIAVRIAAVLLAATLALPACSRTAGDKETAGTILGGIGGAVLGSEVGSGSGRIIATAVGGVIGAWLGSEIGASLDRADQAYAAQAQQQAHEAPVGSQVTWSNPESGNHGTVTAQREGQDQSGNYCREYQTTVTIGGETHQAYGTACRQPDGTWVIVET